MPTANLRTRLVELEAAIVEQKGVLAALERDKIAVQQELDDTATFPILTLPVEITTEIFTWCLPTIQELRRDHRLFGSEDEELGPGTLQAPLSLASCCRAWRAIALATPHLWTTFPLFLEADSGDLDSDSDESDVGDLDVDGTAKPKREHLTKFIDRWLGRAAQRPLTFVFSIAAPGPQHNYRGPACTSLHHVKDLMKRYALQLEHFDLTASFRNAYSLVNSEVKFPLLQRVVLAGFPDDEYYIPDPIDLFPTGAPQFRELFLRDTDMIQVYPIALSCYYFPFDQLTRFEGRIDELLLFGRGSNLIEVKCYFDPGEADFEDSEKITLLNLRSLTLSSPDSDATSFLLGQLTLPALLSLHLSGADPTDPISIGSLLKRSNPPLRSLSVRVDHDQFDPWDHCFAAVGPTLETLEIHSASSSFMNHVLSSSHPALPQLKSLTLLDCPGVNYENLTAFLYRRSTSSALAKLQYFRLIHSPGTLVDENLFHIHGDDVNRTVSDHAHELGRHGMNIHIGSKTKTLISIGST